MAGAASDQLYSILMDTPPENDRDGDEHAPREIGGVSPPNTLEIRWMPAAGGAATLVASAQGGRGPHFARNDAIARLLHDQPRPAVDHHGRLRPPHAAAHHRRRPRQQPAGRRRHPAVAGRHARVRQPAGQALPRHGAARRPRNGGSAHPGPRRQHVVPVKRDVARRRRLPRLDRRRQGGDLGVGRAVLPPGRSTPPSRRRPTSSSSCRARARKARCC